MEWKCTCKMGVISRNSHAHEIGRVEWWMNTHRNDILCRYRLELPVEENRMIGPCTEQPWLRRMERESEDADPFRNRMALEAFHRYDQRVFDEVVVDHGVEHMREPVVRTGRHQRILLVELDLS
mmetsp:Transcript_31330/g.42436  ORF Transcript_31330/g.42436 Transcript_31330/m.42436 type:complete len:124 (-) Transcript_31330:2130-2501(-)